MMPKHVMELLVCWKWGIWLALDSSYLGGWSFMCYVDYLEISESLNFWGGETIIFALFVASLLGFLSTLPVYSGNRLYFSLFFNKVSFYLYLKKLSPKIKDKRPIPPPPSPKLLFKKCECRILLINYWSCSISHLNIATKRSPIISHISERHLVVDKALIRWYKSSTNLVNWTHFKYILKLLVHNPQCKVHFWKLLQKLRLLIHRNNFMNFVHKSRPITHA